MDYNGTKTYSHVFSNITVYPTVKVSSLWGSFDTLCGGVIGGKWDNDGSEVKVLMENVTTAAEMDVFSDVTSAYQWFAYRRCGMLIGHTEENSPKQGLNLNNDNAGAKFLVCENVTVYYGEWVNYDYYEFANQDSDKGKNYPWVRAQAGEHNSAFSNPRYGVPTHNGVPVSGLENNYETTKTNYTPIVFNQLYGGGQGVYGRANHEGVTIVNINNNKAKTVYILNNRGWTDLKLSYQFEHEGNEWTTIVGDGLIIYPTNDADVYKVVVPVTASSFTITGTNPNSDISNWACTFTADKYADKENATFDLYGTLIEGGTPGTGNGDNSSDMYQ